MIAAAHAPDQVRERFGEIVEEVLALPVREQLGDGARRTRPASSPIAT